MILFNYARVETTCHFLTLFIKIGAFQVFGGIAIDCDFPFGIGSSVRYFTILARSELPRPIKILICRIGRGVPNDFDIVYKKDGQHGGLLCRRKKGQKALILGNK